jgi:hypothetical protein
VGFTDNYRYSSHLFLQNGHKHWISGWFSDRSVIPNASLQAVGGRLVAFVDYLNQDLQEDDAVLLRVGNMYIQYNRAKGYNAESNANQDEVTITEAEGSGQVSYALAGLSVGESYAYPDFDNSGHDLIIEVCDMVELSFDYALLSIHLDDGRQTSVCDAPNSFGRIEEPATNVQKIVGIESLPLARKKRPRIAERPGSKLTVSSPARGQ